MEMNHSEREVFGRKLCRLREAVGKSMGDLAEHLGVSVVHVSDVERGTVPPFKAELVTRAADYLGADRVEQLSLANRSAMAWKQD